MDLNKAASVAKMEKEARHRSAAKRAERVAALAEREREIEANRALGRLRQQAHIKRALAKKAKSQGDPPGSSIG